jgi:hypothetical protein
MGIVPDIVLEIIFQLLNWINKAVPSMTRLYKIFYKSGKWGLDW